MKTLLLAGMLGTLAFVAALPAVGAQTPVPPRVERLGSGALLLAPPPADCTGSPRSNDGLDQLSGTPRPTPASESVDEAHLPGMPAAPAIENEIAALVWTFTACQNAGDLARAMALVSDAAVRDIVLTGDLDPEALQPGATPVPFDGESLLYLNVRGVRQLPDGRVGAIVDWCSEANYFVFVPDSGPSHWLIDGEIALDVLGDCLVAK